jgi:hypothetical protein
MQFYLSDVKADLEKALKTKLDRYSWIFEKGATIRGARLLGVISAPTMKLDGTVLRCRSFSSQEADSRHEEGRQQCYVFN